ncbi:unnamed protein product [Mytilus edulis]|uniref:Uncharacterized protein n=1 Tax=Mytilus edulis TaxID=6550 RepID=A0A8S3V1E2_MYTED|nr:unnamed protein product [Mytilus edulis]
MYKFLIKTSSPRPPLLPKTDNPAFQSANTEVENILVDNSPVGKGGTKRKRGNYNNYSPEVRAKMAKYAIENGVQNTARKFTTDLGSPVNESTIRSIKSSYMRRGLHKQFENAAELPKKDRGRPLLLGKYDAELLDYIKSIREFGGIVNNQIVISSAKGILKYHDSELLETLDLTKTWAESVLHRLEN